MGKKHTAKLQPAPAAPRAFTRMRALALAGISLLVIIGVSVYLGSTPDEASQSASSSPASSTAAPDTPVEPPPEALLGPHPQQTLPPLPFGPTPPAAPVAVVQSVYRFAAEHPEILSYVPCYCGCERSGHRGNEDCFVTSRGSNGDVTGWEPHGMT